jgi:hypothetical protein
MVVALSLGSANGKPPRERRSIVNLRKKITLTAAAALMGTALAVTPAAQAQPTEADTPVATVPVAAFSVESGEAIGFDDIGALAYSECGSGWICFFSKADGGGQKCQWSDPLIRSTNCSWMKDGTTAKSVYNRTGHRYHYYLDAGYKNRLGSTANGGKGNLAGSYTIGSLCRHNYKGCPNYGEN